MTGILALILAAVLAVLALLGLKGKDVPPPGPPHPPPPPPPPPPPGGGPAPLPAGVHLTLIVQTARVTPQEVADYLAAQQDQIDHDFSLAWGGSAVIDERPGGWSVFLEDVSDVAQALGYHDVNAAGRPFGRVFVQTSQQAGVGWQSVASHEVLEMLADANAATTDPGPDGCDWYQEVGDPVENLTYERLGVALSDFALPAWWTPGAPRPYDHLNVLTAPFTVTPGGYAVKVCNGQTVQVGGAATRSVDRAYE